MCVSVELRTQSRRVPTASSRTQRTPRSSSPRWVATRSESTLPLWARPLLVRTAGSTVPSAAHTQRQRRRRRSKAAITGVSAAACCSKRALAAPLSGALHSRSPLIPSGEARHVVAAQMGSGDRGGPLASPFALRRSCCQRPKFPRQHPNTITTSLPVP